MRDGARPALAFQGQKFADACHSNTAAEPDPGTTSRRPISLQMEKGRLDGMDPSPGVVSASIRVDMHKRRQT
jgi:hypothetical protein